MLRYGNPLSSCVVKGVSGLLSSSGGKLGLFLEVQQGRDLPSCSEVPFESVQGNQALSHVEGEFGVLLTCGRNSRVSLEFQ